MKSQYLYEKSLQQNEEKALMLIGSEKIACIDFDSFSRALLTMLLSALLTQVISTARVKIILKQRQYRQVDIVSLQ